MKKCSCYTNHPWADKYGYCNGTKNCEICYCDGDESKCDFYSEKRNEKMNTLDMMTAAKTNNKTYKINDMLYNNFNGFHDDECIPWKGRAFNTLNELFSLNDWQEDSTIYMTKSQAEEKYGIKIVGD